MFSKAFSFKVINTEVCLVRVTAFFNYPKSWSLENTKGKRENAGNLDFFPIPQCFLKPSLPWLILQSSPQKLVLDSSKSSNKMVMRALYCSTGLKINGLQSRITYLGDSSVQQSRFIFWVKDDSLGIVI